MRIASLILPIADNAGNPLDDVHACLRADLCDIFGGYTATATFGGWRTPDGAVQHEPGVRYDVAMNSDLDNCARWCALAHHVGNLASQISVMICLPTGTVAFIECAKPLSRAIVQRLQANG